MSFLSGLLKAVGTGLSFVPLPGAGVAGSALKAGLNSAGKVASGVGGALDGLSQTSGKAAQGAAAGRQTEAENILRQDQLRNSQYGTQQGAEMNAGNLDLSRKNFEENARGGRAKQALLASMLGGGFKGTSIDVPGVQKATMSGGLEASLKNPGAQQAMQELMKQALMAQMQQGSPEGEKFTGGKVMAPPPLTALPKAGAMENVLGGVGLGGSLLSSVLGNLQGASAPTTKPGGPASAAPSSLGAMPGGAVIPPTGNLNLPSNDISEILKRLQYQSNQGGG